MADAMGGLLTEAGVPNAVVDLDSLRRAWPTPAGDPFNFGLLLRNLGCVAGNYLDAGVSRLVLAGVAESRENRKRYQDAVGGELAVCRLRADLTVVRQRLVRRHDGDPGGLRWHLDRVEELDRILDRTRVEDFAVDATDGSVGEVAGAVLREVGW
ncbi:hypothetical protein [Streptomyces macrosporus]|uniref:Uncharacterized protein n=1 Tax=Streptomyces macrosporus TaxID=44032 RepID=A0ABN3JJ40_9ACTN